MSKWWLVLAEVLILLAFLGVWYRDWRRDWLRKNPPEAQPEYWMQQLAEESESAKADAFSRALIRDANERKKAWFKWL